VPLLVDGGIRSGVDVLRALALGASAVLVGRPFLWGLAVEGQAGIEAVFTELRDELARAMALCGSRTIGEIDRSLVVATRD
jgi:isopentenyl diphosphate isomerase/L-lactate dehydrogenase-like FMN-dependent dehydrogenase